MSTSPHRIDVTEITAGNPPHRIDVTEITAGTPPQPEETPPSLRALTHAFLAYACSLFAAEPNATAPRRRVRRRQPPDNLIVILVVFLLASNMLWSTLIKIGAIIVVRLTILFFPIDYVRLFLISLFCVFCFSGLVCDR
jgi:hypothetical protein